MFEVALVGIAGATQPVDHHEVGDHQADAVGRRQRDDAEGGRHRHAQQQRQAQEGVAEDQETVALDRVAEVLEGVAPGFQGHHQAHHQDQDGGIGTVLALGQPQVDVPAPGGEDGGGPADQHQIDGQHGIGDRLGLLEQPVGRKARCHHRPDHAIEQLRRQVALELVEDRLGKTKQGHLEGRELVARHQTVDHATVGQDDEALDMALDAEVDHPAQVVLHPFALDLDVGDITGTRPGGLVDTPGHQDGAQCLVDDLDQDQVDQRHLLEPDQTDDADELADRDGGKGCLPTLLLEHRLQHLELGVGGGAEQHDQQVELQLEQPVLQTDPAGQPQREDDQHHHGDEDQHQPQRQRIADQVPKGRGIAQVEDLGNEAGEDLPGTHRGQRQQHLRQAEHDRVGSELCNRQVLHGQEQGSDSGDGSQGLAHQEVFHAGQDAPGTIGIMVGVRHGVRDVFRQEGRSAGTHFAGSARLRPDTECAGTT